MKNFCGVEVNTQDMSLEDLKKYRDKLEKVLNELNHDIQVRIMATAKYGTLS